VELRNAAQGSTSQLVTAPCIHTLVGDNVDLLFWEFATNDEYPHVVKKPTTERVRVAETWIRSALQQNPKALGFLHNYDLNIHGWEIGRPHPPDRSWIPTNYAADHVLRGQGVDAFSVNMFGIMTTGIIFNNGTKQSLLRDAHHPNDLAYNVTADALKLALLTVWQQGFEVLAGSRPRPALLPPHAILQPGLLVPTLHQTPACYMTPTPQFGTAEPILTFAGCVGNASSNAI
jgi:hypothetical protein